MAGLRSFSRRWRGDDFRFGNGLGDAAHVDGGDAADDARATTMLSRVVVTVRLGVIASVAVLLLIGTEPVRAHLLVSWALVAIAVVHGTVAAAHVTWERRSTRQAKLVTVADAVLATGVLASTGGSRSPVIAILVLVVVAAAIRLRPRHAVPITLAVAAAVWVVGIRIDMSIPLEDRVQFAVWWSTYLLFTLAVTLSLSLLAERRQDAAVAARAEALAERHAAEEERDLRERLMASYESQHDGLRVILHEFRTPIVSLRALAAGLARRDGALDSEHRAEAAALMLSHADHLSGMLDGLAEVARTTGSPVGVPQRRRVDVEPFLLAAADAGGLRPPRLRLRVHPSAASVVVEASRLRRIVTNLCDNAVRHAGDGAVDLDVRVVDRTLRLTLTDRGPGLAPERLRLGVSPGASGLGLWIVERLISSLGGQMEFHGRDGGGLVIRLTIPV